MKQSARPVLVLAGGVLLAIAVIFLLAVVLPTTTKAQGAIGVPKALSAMQQNGRRIYVREGCETCHSRMIRDSASDAMLGPSPSTANDYLGEGPSLIGLDRIGPDLSCVGNKLTDKASIVAFLKHPDYGHKNSAMPRYAYLSASELNALAAYLQSLTCAVLQ
ncbi:MAG: cbb3-type cytochrome c oxidase subunit II [Actinomycetota bacterium]